MAELKITKELEEDLIDILRRLVANIDEVKRRENQTDFNKGIDIYADYKDAVNKILKRTASPDMYEALQIALGQLICTGSKANDEIVDIIRKAIAKAEGKNR